MQMRMTPSIAHWTSVITTTDAQSRTSPFDRTQEVRGFESATLVLAPQRQYRRAKRDARARPTYPIEADHSTIAAPQVMPPPNAAKASVSPCRTRPRDSASQRAIGIDAADVLPNRPMSTKTFERSG